MRRDPSLIANSCRVSGIVVKLHGADWFFYLEMNVTRSFSALPKRLSKKSEVRLERAGGWRELILTR